MLDDAAWERANAEFLGTALAWLRARLENFGPHLKEEAVAPAPDDAALRSVDVHSTRKKRSMRSGPATFDHLPFDGAMDPPPALVELARRFGLSAFERDVLLLCVAMELDTRTGALCARAHDDPLRSYPTFALALSLFDDPAWEALSPERPLRYWRLLEIPERGTKPLTAAPLRADERIVNFVKGLNHLDERLMDLAVAIKPTADDGDLPPTQQHVAECIFRAWKDEPLDAPPAKLVGPDAASSSRVATEVTAALGRRLFNMNVDVLPRGFAELDALARLWRRETALLPVALYLNAHDVDAAPESGWLPSLRRFVARAGGYIFVAMPELGASLGTATAVYDVAKPTRDEQRVLWEVRLGDARHDSATRLVSQFNLDAATIATIVRREMQEPAVDDLDRRLWDACRAALRPKLDALAQRLDTKATWDDLVLPPQQVSLLRQIAAQVPARHHVYERWGFGAKMNRGFGVTALFAGESGTGKTMSAEVIANELSLNLYRIDLSAVVSKYIGETEKNLRTLFDAADDGGAILFFDEADALFGKRSEVRDSHDRYANIETNYLLQRMESFRGLAILATNLKSSIDQAFTRRLRFIVSFPHPGIAERRQMWLRAFPSDSLGEILDFERLSKINATGSVIMSAALNAAFLAADGNTKITLEHVLSALRQEFTKADRPVNELEFALNGHRGAV